MDSLGRGVVGGHCSLVTLQAIFHSGPLSFPICKKKGLQQAIFQF